MRMSMHGTPGRLGHAVVTAAVATWLGCSEHNEILAPGEVLTPPIVNFSAAAGTGCDQGDAWNLNTAQSSQYLGGSAEIVFLDNGEDPQPDGCGDLPGNTWHSIIGLNVVTRYGGYGWFRGRLRRHDGQIVRLDSALLTFTPGGSIGFSGGGEVDYGVVDNFAASIRDGTPPQTFETTPTR